MPGPWDDYAPSAKPAGPWDDYASSTTEAAPAEKPFLEKLGNFARNVYENPPPTVAAVRDIIKGAPAAATELTYGADPQAAEQAAGTMLNAAALGIGFKGPGGTNVGVLGRPITAEGRAAPLIPSRPVLPPTTSEQAVEAAARGGYTLPAYVATEGTVIPQVASSVKNVPWAGQPITRTHDELLANMGRAAGDITGGVAGSPEAAGDIAKTGLTAFIKTRSQEPVRKAYEAVDALIDPNIRVPLDNTREAIGQIMAERTAARIPGQSKAVQTVFDAVQDPRGMDYAGTKGLRSFLGEKTPQDLAVSGISPVENKRIYGALSKDLGNVVRQSSPGAFSAWQEANALARLTSLQREALSKVTGATGDASPEMVFNRLVTYANSKAGADLNRLRLAKRAMGPGAWSEVGSALIDRLGKAPDGTFSPQRFVTAFGNMAPAARNELFSGQQLAAMTDLFTVSKHVHDRITRFGNPSGTARGGIVGSAVTGGAIFAEPLTVLTTLVGTRLVAEALSRPAVVRAATAVSRASLSGNPYRTQRALAALRAAVVAAGLAAPPPRSTNIEDRRRP